MKHLPNIITLCNALCGSIAIVQLFQGKWELVFLFFAIGLLCDFLDGLVARALKVSSELGKQLDSLSDAITFGILPAMVSFVLLTKGQNGSIVDFNQIQWWHYTGFVILLFSILRLGKFNIDTRQSHSFIGLPTPANAIIWISLLVIALYNPSYQELIYNPIFLLSLTILTSILLIAELPLFALKFLHYRWKGNEIKYLFIISSIILVLTIKFLALPMIIISYITFSVIHNTLYK